MRRLAVGRMLALVLLTLVPAVSCMGNYTWQEAERFLNDLYMETKYWRGCETPIKCSYSNNGSWVDAASTNGNEARCCYDCDKCHGDRCYRGWQCCKDDGNGNSILKDDNMLYYPDTMYKYVTCEQLLRYEKMSYEDIMFETAVNENQTYIMQDRAAASYQMISKCPPQSIHDETVALCEKSSPLGPVLDNIPFISKNSLQLYKNRHCVKCHQMNSGYVNDTFVPFDLLLSAETIHYKYMFTSAFESVHDLVNFTLPIMDSENDTLYRIILQTSMRFLNFPELNNRRIPPCGIEIPHDTPCDKSLSGNNDSYILEQSCKMFLSPLRIATAGLTYIARNLACAQCRDRYYRTGPYSPMDSGYRGPQPVPCSTEMVPGPSIVLNVQPAIDEINGSFEDAGSERLIGVSPGKGRVAGCPRGFFWDTLKLQCRQILCPRRNYIYRGICEPLYKDTVRHSYYVKIKAVPKKKPAVLKEKQVYKHEQRLADVIRNETGMQMCYRNILLKLASRTKFSYIIYEYALTPSTQSSYISVLQKLKFTFNSSLQEVLKRNSTLFDGFHFEPADNVFLPQTSVNPTALDSNDGTILIQLRPGGNDMYIIRSCGGLIDISKQDFCYRMRLESTEYKIETANGVPRLIVNASGKVIYRDNYNVQLDGSARICIDDYDAIPIVKQSESPPTVPNIDIVHEDSSQNFDLVFIIIAASVFAFVLIVGIVNSRRSIVQWLNNQIRA